MSKVVFITGVSSGFGKAAAKTLSSGGFTVYGTSRKARPDDSPPYTVLKMDVRDPGAVNASVSEVLKREGGIDVLVNNAGIAASSPLEETLLADLEEVMNTNFKGPIRMCQAVLPSMRKKGSGLIISVSSIGGQVGLPFMGSYCASKFALEGVMESLSMEVQSYGISVCLVEPGDFNTEIIQHQKIADLEPGSPYRKAMQKLVQASNKSMESAPGPQAVADTISRIIRSKKPRLRYRVGTVQEKLSVALKAALPSRRFEKMLLSYYNMDNDD